MPTLHSSKDFSKTRPELVPHQVERLIHRQVLATGGDHEFDQERGHPVGVVDLPSHTVSMTIGVLREDEATRSHRHNYETILYIVRGQGESEIGDKVVAWEAGDAVYVPNWEWHSHRNTGDEVVHYVAVENTPLLQNLGNIALRQEANETEGAPS